MASAEMRLATTAVQVIGTMATRESRLGCDVDNGSLPAWHTADKASGLNQYYVPSSRALTDPQTVRRVSRRTSLSEAVARRGGEIARCCAHRERESKERTRAHRRAREERVLMPPPARRGLRLTAL